MFQCLTYNYLECSKVKLFCDKKDAKSGEDSSAKNRKGGRDRAVANG